MLGKFWFGAAGILSVAPAAIASAPAMFSAAATYGTQAVTASLSSRFIGASVDATFQYIQNSPNNGWGLENFKNMNITSIGFSAINPL